MRSFAGWRQGRPCGPIPAVEGLDAESGAITAEFATTLPAVMLLVALVLSFGAALGTGLRVTDAARVGARAAALGYSHSEVQSRAQSVSGPAAQVQIRLEQGWATVTVRHPLGFGRLAAGPFQVSSSATAWIEP